MKLIDKDALVAEIKKRQSEHDEKKYDYASSDHFCASVEDGKILSLIDTLDVKEVDLENSVKGRIKYPLIGVDFPNIYPNYRELKDYCDKNGIKDEDNVKIIIMKGE